MKNILILYSGGLDSTTALYKFKDKIKLSVSFNYGAKHNEQEIKYAKINCKKLSIPHEVIDIDFNEIGIKSNLLKSGGEIPQNDYNKENMSKTVVPFRNGIMLSIAGAIAESNDCKIILISNHSGDHEIYPDCRSEFIENMNKAIESGTNKKIQIYAPFTHLSKREIAKIGKGLNIDYSLTYSCYEGSEIPCGKCATCRERIEALK